MDKRRGRGRKRNTLKKQPRNIPTYRCHHASYLSWLPGCFSCYYCSFAHSFLLIAFHLISILRALVLILSSSSCYVLSSICLFIWSVCLATSWSPLIWLLLEYLGSFYPFVLCPFCLHGLPVKSSMLPMSLFGHLQGIRRAHCGENKRQQLWLWASRFDPPHSIDSLAHHAHLSLFPSLSLFSVSRLCSRLCSPSCLLHLLLPFGAPKGHGERHRDRERESWNQWRGQEIKETKVQRYRRQGIKPSTQRSDGFTAWRESGFVWVFPEDKQVRQDSKWERQGT